MVYLGRRGQATLLIVSVLCVVGVIVLMSSLDVFTKDYNYKSTDFDQVLLDEATSSSFAVMESALSRRLWEPPPDGSCLKAATFNVTGTLPSGVTWKVDTTFNFTTKNFEMTATGKYRNLTSIFKKRVKVLDVSDYLLFSGSTNPVSINRGYNEDFPASMIAKDRRIYTKGPLNAYSMIHRPNPNTDWNGSPSIWPGEYGTILQGDRMQFGGGIYYTPYVIPAPNPGYGNLSTLLAPYADIWGGPSGQYWSTYGAGSMIFTKDSALAETLNQQVINHAAGPLSKTSVKTNVYPQALFGGAPPLEAWKASDSGTYFNDVDKYSIFYYGYAGANEFGVRNNPTCISKTDSFTTKKYCSHSEHFPKGFSKWRKDAGLDGYLYTSDSEAVPSPTMNWDNLEALEEDAQVCGQVVSAPTSAYEDCPVWDKKFLKQYALVGSGLACPKTSRLDMEALALNNFDPAQLADPSLKDRLLRRVIYLKVPTEIKQSNLQGLMVGSLSNNAARKNLSLWVVGEDTVTLRGMQSDLTSPLSVDSARLREVMFNQDTTASGKTSISMVLLSPEQVHLISPFYIPMNSTQFKSYWPTSGGKIKPINHNLTDTRYEEDGFKYGYRRFYLNNISLITTSATNVSNPFYLQGLWSGPDSSANQFTANQCMVTLAGQPLPPLAGSLITDAASMPAYAGAPLSPLPAPSSKYYESGHLPQIYYPNVFKVQNVAMGNARQESDLFLTGIRIYVDFDAMVIPGKRDLNTPLHDGGESRFVTDVPFDLSHKHFAYDRGVYYYAKPPMTPCVESNVAYLVPSTPTAPYDPYGVLPSVNNGRYIFVHTAPASDYRNIGSIVGVDQPVIETRNSK
ncbi:hypothetical protein [Bdellovibrio svalbardensis]|uniref:Flp pilus-assembly TadG-like N-terminal domain-containing protein n=1 Tax=Bdellovibrio svalbardensis TaxID=2972972 RepID=A0ABT6DGH7_9BACT|nr:hypothetical protein [Bdellovibrio svalbardensis]MDG0814966.1 hypothetical protein [Bdellovibrio svalbardensis]